MQQYRKSLPLLILFLFLSTNSNADTFIACPTNTINADITTKLPGGWWSTPQQGSLAATEVMQIGGKSTLWCGYNAYGTKIGVMHEAPPGLVCTANKKGFNCAGQGKASKDKNAKADIKRTSPPAPTPTVTLQAAKENNTVVQNPKLNTKLLQAAAGCAGPDLSIRKILVKNVRRNPDGTYFFVLNGYVENISKTTYVSAANQQSVNIYTVPQGGGAKSLYRSTPFASPTVSAGGSVEAKAIFNTWRMSNEFSSGYEFIITYDPDIGLDGNTANDDCNLKNNSFAITGQQINDMIRASGR